MNDDKSKRSIKYYERGNYHAVCGKVTDVLTELNGVPFFGGPRYNVKWEDGLFEQCVNAKDLVNLFKNTPQSIGCSTQLDMRLMECLLSLGKRVGLFFESQNRKVLCVKLPARNSFGFVYLSPPPLSLLPTLCSPTLHFRHSGHAGKFENLHTRWHQNKFPSHFKTHRVTYQRDKGLVIMELSDCRFYLNCHLTFPYCRGQRNRMCPSSLCSRRCQHCCCKARQGPEDMHSIIAYTHKS